LEHLALVVVELHRRLNLGPAQFRTSCRHSSIWASRCPPGTRAHRWHLPTARIKALPLQQLEALTDALLDFAGAADLASWLAEHAI